MASARSHRILLSIFLLAIPACPPLLAFDGPSAISEETTTLTGRALCPERSMTPASGVDPCNELGTPFTFVTEAGEVVAFVDGDPIAEMFTDPRVRGQLLEITGWHRDGDRFELLAVHSIKNGVRHHVHYRCDVCDIDATAPGPCWCCGQEFELREDPIDPAGSP